MKLQIPNINSDNKGHIDEETFNRLINDNYNHFLSLAKYNIPKLEDAEDILQSALACVCKNRKSIEDEEHFNAYVAKAIKNARIKYYINKEKRKTRVDYSTKVEDIPTFMDDPEEYDKLIASLPEDEKDMLNMHFEEGYSKKQISDLLNMKDSTVRSKFSRSIKKLRDKLGKVGFIVFILCFAISVTVIAVSIIKSIQNMFRVKNENVENTAVLEAIENNGWFQKSDMDYVDLGDGYKIKLDYFVLDEMCLYLVFDLGSEKDLSKYNEFSILDLRIENENGEIICDKTNFNSNQYQRVNSTKTIKHNDNNLKLLIYMYTDSFPLSSSLNIKFSKLALHKRTLLGSDKYYINSNFDTSVTLSKKFKNRTYVSYIPDNETLRKAIISETGFYGIISLDSSKEIDAKLLDSNGTEYKCFTSALINYKDKEKIDYIIVSNYNDKNSETLTLIIDNIEYKLKNQP